MIEQMLNRSCPIDGVAFQMHIDLNFNSSMVDKVRSNIQRYAKLGLQVHFSSVTVSCVKTNVTCVNATWTSDDLQKQADLYSSLL
jgi:GH35 family endo-1,4-beta-xylanase